MSILLWIQRSAKSSVRRRPEFIIDKAPWLIDALKSLDLEVGRSVLSERNLVESLFSSLKLKHSIKIFFCSISSFNPVKNWNLFCKLFMLYYNRLRWRLC
ncbi:hypothetical protein FHEFKHOI_00336 [Candidatus Methanoperedenaceae archaeon GB50]|nr:hypothetical protein AIOGIFDO_00332 [Candidatus Methanoperedenaceae archaeon GB37]CAD7768582.1 hypothetical protein FHEFKHOI_00336 [Candidatus Methanoperedenaceae archaeon GB50]CAD7779170.1 MAG: hypothetical protein KBONHNOK_01264 [Candidatus Methanoperedenaceae archaeon GB50]